MAADVPTQEPRSGAARQSRVGKRPLVCPKGVTLKVSGRDVSVQGPKGQLHWQLPLGVTATDGQAGLTLQSSESGRDAARLQGLARAILANLIRGAASGFEKTLELVGTGYRCEVSGNKISFQLGLSHPTVIELPKGVSASVPADSKGTILVLNSADKAVVGQLAATIRALRPPEPYAGKGIRYRGEAIQRKAGKAGKARK